MQVGEITPIYGRFQVTAFPDWLIKVNATCIK